MAPRIELLSDLRVPMRDGVELAIDVYLPDGAVPRPALLALSAYGRKSGMVPGLALSTNVPPTIEQGHTERLVELGYAHIVGDVRGTGESDGRYAMWGRPEQEDCYDLIEWIGTQPWCDGNVGMIGISYFAMLQVPAAALAPPHLKAILPFEPAGTDLYRDWFYQGGLLNRQFLLVWSQFVAAAGHAPLSADLMTSAEIADAVARVRELPEIAGDEVLEAILADPTVNPIVFDALMHTEDGPFYDERSASSVLHQVEVPAYFGTWGNINYIDALGGLRGYHGVASEHRKLVIGPPVFPDRPSWQYPLETERWYGRWLKDERNGIEDEAPVRIFVTGANTWRDSRCWPLEGTRFTDFHLHPGGWLHEYPPIAGDGASPFTFQLDEHSGVCFESSVLIEDTEVVGPAVLDLHASTSCDDASWIVSMYDRAPDGRALLLTRGWLKASHRAVDASRSTPWQPHHPHDARVPVTPDEPTRYSIELMPVTHRFRAGHRMLLEISCDDLGYIDGGRGWLASLVPTDRQLIDELMLTRFFTPHSVDRRPKTLHVHHDAEYPSRLVLPVVEGNVLGTSSYLRADLDGAPVWMGG